MNVHPDLPEFRKLAERGNTVPVYVDLTADCETPVGAYAKLRGEGPSFLFESIVGGERISRYSFLGMNPRTTIRALAGEVVLEHRDGRRERRPAPADPLRVLEEEMSRYHPVRLPGMPPFTGGAVGFIGYEYVHCIEPTVLKPDEDALGMPVLNYLIADSVLVFDHVRQVLRVCVSAHVEGGDAAAAHAAAVDEIRRILARLEGPVALEHAILEDPGDPGVPAGNFTREAFEAMVERTKEYIRAGDIIQAVLSQRFEKNFSASPVALYRALRTVNPSPYMFLFEDEDFSVVGASPEVHVRLTGREVEIRPIAGTRHRGATEEEDLALERELLADEKERAEHLMLVDLARNDIGRVCDFGTVSVPDYMTVERYSHVMHIVSQVTGRIRADATAYDLMRATFPAGTLSGAPKVRAMQIISELECSQRGVYAGALGYFGYEGNHDSCIGIRTALLKKGKIYIQSGAGLVADSVPANEFMETVNKARAMLKAVELAERAFGAGDAR